MPGNEVGDRVHNFFDQGSLSQDHQHSQFVASNWPRSNANIWNTSERQIGGHVNTGSQHYISQQSDFERGQGIQFPLGPNGLNLAQPNMRPEFVKNPSQIPQLNLNGFMHTSQQRSGSLPTNSASFGGSESQLNFSFLGGQHQMNGQQAIMMQSLPQQQLGNNNTQLPQQQQYILKQMELQRQHQLQQFAAIQRSAAGHTSPFQNETGQHPPSLNGNSLHDTSNYSWPSQVTASNMNWQQRRMSSSVPGYSNGFMISPEQGQTMQFMGLIPPQTSHSLYGVPVSSSRSSNAFFHGNNGNPGMLEVPAPNSSFSGNQYGTHAYQAGAKEGNTVSRYESEGKGSFELTSSQGLGNMINLGGFTQVQQTEQRNSLMPEASRQGFAGGTEFVSEKSVAQASSQVASTQAAVGLDPTEEKILFGSDDNIWEAFGGASLAGSGDATDLLNGFPSMQSGTWSALMQSAVAETSSTDGGVPEEWSGRGSQNSRPQSGCQHPSSFINNEKSQHNMVNSSQRASLDSQHGNNDLNFHNANANSNSNSNVNYVNSSVQPQQFANQRRDEIQPESKITQVGRILDSHQQKTRVEEKRGVENSNTSRDFSRTNSGFWGHQQSSFLPSNAHQIGQPSLSNFIGSVPANGSIASSNQVNLFDKDREVQMGMDTGRGAAMRLESAPNSNNKMGKDNAGAPGLSNMKVNLESGQNLLDNHHDLWRSVNSSGKTGFEGAVRDQHNLDKGPLILESSNNSPGTTEIHEAENGERKESSSDSHRSNFPSNTSVGKLREDKRSLPGGKEKSLGQAGKGGPITRKFHYHPMGDVDVNLDSSRVLHSQSIPHHLFAGVQGQEANLRSLGPLSTSIIDVEGRLPNHHGPINVSRGASPAGAHPGYLHNMSTSFVRTGELSSPNQHMSPSQNMLELLHKVDQSKEQIAASHLSSSEYNKLSDAPVGGVAGPSQSHLSTSHGFSLQLAPPSQGIAPSNLGDATQSSFRTVGSSNTGHVASEIGDKTHSWLASISSAQCLPPSHQPTQTESGSGPDRLGNTDANLSVHHLKDNSYVTSHRVTNSHGNLHGRDWNRPGMRALMRQMPDSFHAAMAGMSRKDKLSHVGHLWASQQHLLGSQASDTSEMLKSQFQSPASKSSLIQQKGDEQDDPKRVDALSSQGILGREESQTAEAQSSVQVAGTSQEEPSVKHQPEASSSCPAIKQNDYDFTDQNNTALNYSMLHQTQTMKNIGSNPSHRESKRLKGEDDGLKQIAGQVAAPITNSMNSMSRDLHMRHTSVSAGDAMMLKFSPQLGNRNTFQLPHGTVRSQDMLSFGHGDPQKFAAGNVTPRTNLTGISPQMAPSWFEQYGTFKNGQLLPVHNVTRVPMKNVEQQVINGNLPNNLVEHNSVQLAVAEARQIAKTFHTASDHISSLHALVPNVSTPISASMRPKKRKTATSDLLSWSKEIGVCLRRLQNMSSAEVDWAQLSNRLVEKVEDETDNNEDPLSMTKPSRRLLLTTQLLQQVFQPPSAAVLSLDASSNYEVIVYSLARSVLGDACGSTCVMESNSSVDSANPLHGKVKTSERIQDQYFSKVVEDFTSREKELENELSRLDKRASILDFRLECQDLERFSVINRFARFHGRGQVDGAETSSSSDANATVHKPGPQRYVSAYSMPRNVPESVQCLSL